MDLETKEDVEIEILLSERKRLLNTLNFVNILIVLAIGSLCWLIVTKFIIK